MRYGSEFPSQALSYSGKVFPEREHSAPYLLAGIADGLVGHLPWGVPYWAASDGEVTHVTASESSAAPRE